MLRINQQRNAAAAKSYHGSVAEYHRPGGEQEIVGQWGGKASERLDLAGDVLRPHFERLCDNRHPFTGEQLTARMRKDRRVGYDFTFDVCKSVSILYGVTDDPAILDAFRLAIRATMREMEAGVRTRIRKRGQFAERVVGNMAWGEFFHFTARPVKGKIDPHLHAHCFVPNLCWDHAEKLWKAIDVASIKADGAYWQTRFQKRFGHRLAELGYAVAWKGDNFEIEGIDRSMIDRFSRRTLLINHTADNRGITDAQAKDKLGALTRERKHKAATMPELRAEWWERLTDDERAGIAQAALRQRRPLPDGKGRIVEQPSRPGALARLKARAASPEPERDAWERERREFIRQRQQRTGQPSPASPAKRQGYGR